MIGSYPLLNKAYFVLLMLGLGMLAISAAALLALKSAELFFATLSNALILILAGIVSKILVWYNVYSEVVTKEEFKKATTSGSVFKKKQKH